MEYIFRYDSPLGPITLASDGEALTGLWFDDQRFFGDTLEEEHEEKDLPVFEETVRWLDLYFSGEDPGFRPPLKLRGSSFRREVWNILSDIPYGKTRSYGEIAAIVGRRRGMSSMSSQAVGSAIGHNPISLIVPCHRVIKADGGIGEYAGGTERKIALLELEKGTKQ